MQIYRHIAELAGIDCPTALALGVFDGVHLGHQAVIGAAIDDARSAGGISVVATFEPHPVRVLRPDVAPRLLASFQHKRLLLERLGVDGLLVIPFDRVLAAQPPEMFVSRITEACRDLRSLSVGRDWRFGAERAGDADLLATIGEDAGFSVNAISPVEDGGSPISSTRVRAAIEAGDIQEAKALLGRDYTVLGTIVAGRQLGRTIGFPTANLRVHSEQLPPDGVYAVRALRHGNSATALPGVANLGVRPTVESGESRRMLEVHLFDFDEEIYGDDLEITFVQQLRAEKKFDGVEALKTQIQRDAAEARELLSKP